MKSTPGLKCEQHSYFLSTYMPQSLQVQVDAHQGLCLPFMFWIMPAAVMSGVSVVLSAGVLLCGWSRLTMIINTRK